MRGAADNVTWAESALYARCLFRAELAGRSVPEWHQSPLMQRLASHFENELRS